MAKKTNSTSTKTPIQTDELVERTEPKVSVQTKPIFDNEKYLKKLNKVHELAKSQLKSV